MEQTLAELIRSAVAMLRDRHPKEAKLIYSIAKLDNEERAAIIIAYERFLKDDDV